MPPKPTSRRSPRASPRPERNSPRPSPRDSSGKGSPRGQKRKASPRGLFQKLICDMCISYVLIKLFLLPLILVSSRKLRERSVDESKFVSHDPCDTALHPLINFTLRRIFWEPLDVLRTQPRGMSVKQKIEAHVEYPPDAVLFKLWQNDREEYDRIKREMFSHPKCGGMDFFTEGLYTELRKHGNEEFHEGKSYVSYSNALESANSVKRTLDKEPFGNTRFELPTYYEEPNNSTIHYRVRMCNTIAICLITLCLLLPGPVKRFFLQSESLQF